MILYITFIVLVILLILFTNYKENFTDLIDPEKIFFLQGNTLPYFKDNKYPKINFDINNPSARKDFGNTIFPFTFNKCDINCCNKNSNLTCQSGCVCLTDTQIKNMF